MTAAPFPDTRWTLVQRAQGRDQPGQLALSELCEACYPPLVRFLTTQGRAEEAARDLAHSFFAELLSHGLRGQPEADRGRFRSYLLGALKHFLSRQRAAAQAAKRGSGQTPISLDDPDLPPTLQGPAHQPASDQHLDSAWALNLIQRSLQALEQDPRQNAQQFQILKPWLTGPAEQSQAEAARQLGLSETACKVAIHRLRQRFRQQLREQIAATVTSHADLEDELRHLIQILSSSTN